jgi:hypothetical protein
VVLAAAAQVQQVPILMLHQILVLPVALAWHN